MRISKTIRKNSPLAAAAVLLFLGATAAAGCGDAETESTASAAADKSSSFRVLSPSTAGHNPGDKASLPSSALWTRPLRDAELEAGRQVWVGTCIQCHSTGLGGAPLIGNKEMWLPRLEQGLDVLTQHALEGFYGDAGEMPARGGNAELSDDEVASAVRFMTSRARQ